MKIVSYAVRNIIGLSELKLTGGASVELTGPTGAGKTSGLDAMKFALTGTTGRSVTVREGAESGEVELILDDGTTITRKAYPDKAGAVKIQRDGMERLDEKRRKELYRTCIESGLTVLATRVTDTDGLAVNLLDVAYSESEAANGQAG